VCFDPRGVCCWAWGGVYVCVMCVCVCVCACASLSLSLTISLSLCICVCLGIFWYLYVCLYVFMYICMSVCMYVCMYVCIYVCKYIWLPLAHTCDMTRSYVWHDSLIRVTWLVHTCDMTGSYSWNDSFQHVAWHATQSVFTNSPSPPTPLLHSSICSCTLTTNGRILQMLAAWAATTLKTCLSRNRERKTVLIRIDLSFDASRFLFTCE